MRDDAANHNVRQFHHIPPPKRHVPPPRVVLILPDCRTDLSCRSLQKAEPAMTDTIAAAPEELTAAVCKMTASLTVFDSSETSS